MSLAKRASWILLAAVSSDTVQHLKALRRWEWLNLDETRSLQQETLKRLICHAYTNVPWYREVFKQVGVVRWKERVDLGAFRELPLLTKDVIRTNYRRLTSRDLHRRRWFENTSGGSTGEPVRFVQDKAYGDWNRAVTVLSDLWTGYRRGERRVRLWGSERDLWVGRETLAVQLRRWLSNEIWLNAFRMTPQQKRQYIDRINSFRPKQITAYVESIYDIARLIEKQDILIHAPRAIVSTAGTLYPVMRQTIERAFRCPVFNRYGSREVGGIACECNEHSGLHVSPFTHLVEILRPDGTPAEAGELGEIVVTLLTNYAMPLIRYRIGDSGTWAVGGCSCGRSWPLLGEVAGRVSDIFHTREGTSVHGEYFMHLFYFRDWIAKVQLIQESVDRIRIVVAPAIDVQDPTGAFASDIADIRQKVRFVMGRRCDVQFNFVEDIPPSPSGKYQYTISKVPAARGGPDRG